MLKKICKNEFYFFIGILIFRIVIDFIYYNQIAPSYSYMGFTKELNISRLIYSYFILLIGMLMIIKIYKYKINLPSAIMIIMLFMTSFVPNTSLIALKETSYKFMIEYFFYWFIILEAYILLPSIKIKNINKELSSKTKTIMIFIFSITVVFISAKYTGFNITLDLDNVYDLRMEARNFHIPTILRYLLAESRIIIPIFIVQSLKNKKYFIGITLVIIELINFGIDGTKSVLFGLVLAIITFKVKLNKKNIALIPSIMTIYALLSSCIMVFFNDISLVSYLRRMIYLPAYLNQVYYKFFSLNQADFFRQSFLRYLGFESPYKSDIPFIIGEIYSGKLNVSANNGLFSDAYANMGFLGILVMPIVLVLIMRLFDSCANGVDKNTVAIASLILTFSINGSFLFTVLITHGFLVACLVLYLMPKDKDKLQTNIY